ncbi:MAG: FAD-binding protein, partial [Rhodoluna sp.]|nr:FAD-binding protein [Rhodoluna sp.]
MQKLSQLTTMRVGGEPAEIIVAKTRDDLIELTLEAWRSGEDWLILGGGSNLVVADEVEDLHVIKVETKGIESLKGSAENKTVLRIQAGENWDNFVDHAIEHGLAGVEGMAGIPGTVGAGPVQNIG